MGLWDWITRFGCDSRCVVLDQVVGSARSDLMRASSSLTSPGSAMVAVTSALTAARNDFLARMRRTRMLAGLTLS